MKTTDELSRELRAHLKAGQLEAALALAWQILDTEPDSLSARLSVIHILSEQPNLVTDDRKSALERLLLHPAVDPRSVAPAGWHLLQETIRQLGMSAPEDTVPWLETDRFAQNLLKEACVTNVDAEIVLTRARRWLLLSGRSREFPAAVEALVTQARHNGGAWLFDDVERAQLKAHPTASIVHAFLPPRPAPSATDAGFSDAITAAVAEQYEGWPYPAWSRATVFASGRLAATIRKCDPHGPDSIPPAPEVLVAGCGTGYEPATWALRYPEAQITAIDLSSSSLRYGAQRCAAAGLHRIQFLQLDLHRVAEMGKTFDAIACSGVLHHLPDPEAGWEALTKVLRPGGVMEVMVYSKIARMLVRAWRTQIADLLEEPIDDDLLRKVRKHFIDKGRPPLSPDFYDLGGVHDLLLHRQEDPFDVARIKRAIQRFGLELIRFQLPTEFDRANYLRENPQDSLFRNYELWQAQELRRPDMFTQMYHFWCRKPLKS